MTTDIDAGRDRGGGGLARNASGQFEGAGDFEKEAGIVSPPGVDEVAAQARVIQGAALGRMLGARGLLTP
jgi:hypothetical protein